MGSSDANMNDKNIYKLSSLVKCKFDSGHLSACSFNMELPKIQRLLFHMGIQWHLYVMEHELKSVIKLNEGLIKIKQKHCSIHHENYLKKKFWQISQVGKPAVSARIKRQKSALNVKF